MSDPEPQVQLTLCDIPAPPGAERNEPLSVRLRFLLKYARRSLRLRCVDARFLPPADEGGEKG